MYSTIKVSFCSVRFWIRLSRILFVWALAFVSSYCTQPESQTTNATLTDDEVYLVDAYDRIAKARDVRSLSYVKSESLFTMLDSTLDSTRIANTILNLNRDPDRWLLVFRSIERKLMTPSQGGQSEETR